MSTFRVSVDLAGMGLLFDGIAGDAEAAARPSAQAIAQVLYDEVKSNVSRIKRKTGNLAASIYQAYSADNSLPGRATYHVSWNARKAPHGHLVEFGHLQRYEITYNRETRRFVTHRDRPLAAPKQIAAKPFIRPALGKVEIAAAAGKAEFLQRMGHAP